MKICFIGGARYGQPPGAAIDKKFQLLGELGEVHVIGFSRSLRPRRFDHHAHFYLLPQFPIAALRHLAMLLAGGLLVAWLVWRRGVRVVVAQSPYEAWGAAWVKRWSPWRVALVVESHGGFGSHVFVQRKVWFPWLTRLAMRKIARFSLSQADVLRSISNWTRRDLEALAPGKPVIEFPTWSDIEPFAAEGRSRREPTPSILYAGALIPGKGVQHLLRAFAAVAEEFPETRLDLAGPPLHTRHAAELRRLAAELGLDGRVDFLGAVPQPALARRMAEASVFVLPSLSEGLGRVVFEAMATGTPVIASRTGGIPDMIQHGVTGILSAPGDEAELAAALRRILRDPAAASAMGQRGREFALTFFSPEKYRAGYAAVFDAAFQAAQRSAS